MMNDEMVKIGPAGIAVVAFALLTACGSSKDGTGGGGTGNNGGPCGTLQSPTVLTLTGLEPALDARVPNSAIVHRFTISGTGLLFQPSFALSAEHTAGNFTVVGADAAGGQWIWTEHAVQADFEYESAPIVWANAPAHVVLNPGTLQQDPQTGCVYTFPTPIFRYDVVSADDGGLQDEGGGAPQEGGAAPQEDGAAQQEGGAMQQQEGGATQQEDGSARQEAGSTLEEAGSSEASAGDP